MKKIIQFLATLGIGYPDGYPDSQRVMCPICHQWWPTDSEAAACYQSHK